MSPQLDPVAELDGIKTHADNPRTHSSPTVEQLLQAGEVSQWSPVASPLSGKENDLEGDQPHHKKSLLSKMKEKARKLQQSLSHRKKHDEEDDSSPSSGVKLEAYGVGEEEEDAEYLGAPMYESEKAPEELKETARQHPRADPVIFHKHVLSIPAKHGAEPEKEKPIGTNQRITETITEKMAPAYAKEENFASPHKPVTETVPENLAPADLVEKPTGPSKTVAETMTEKLAPTYAKVSDVTNAMTSKIQGLSVSAPTEQEIDGNDASEINKDVTAGTDKPAGSETKTVSYGEQVWDKGVSVKEFIMQKFEPGEDDRALSQVISEAMSPRKASDDTGMVGRVKGAVSSLIWDEASNNPRATKSAPNSPLKVPISTKTYEIVEEENHGRILQPN